MITTKLQNSLSKRLLSSVFTIYFSITIFITLAQIAIEYYETKQAIHKELVSLEDTFKQSLSDAIWDLNIVQIDSISQSIYKLPFVKEIRIIDNSKNIISHHHNEESKSDIFHSFNIYKNYEGATLLLARVEISSDKYSVIDRVKTGIYLIIFNAMIKSFLLLILFLWAFKKYLIHPLSNFTNQLKDFNLENIGNKTIQLDTHEGDEIHLLKNSFNTMINEINNQKNIILNIKTDYLHKLEEEVKQRTDELKKSNIELNKLATVDYLTNIRNRRSFYDISTQYFTIAKRKIKQFSIISLDIDYFKKINDTYGHQVGDIALVEFTKNCEKQLRESDIFGRLGGEEFAIAILDTPKEDVLQIANRILTIISDIKLQENGATVSFTVSIGITHLREEDTKLENIINRADQALYSAKEQGRNRVVVH